MKNRYMLAAIIVALVAFLPFMLSAPASAQLAAPKPAQQSGSPVVSVPGAVPQVSADVPQQTAVAVKEVNSPAAPSHFGDQAIWALMVSFLIQWLKKSPWFGWITPESAARLKTQFGFLAAFLTAAGIHFAVSGSLLDGGGASITVTGLSVNAFKDVAWQWASQQGWYQLLVKEPKEVQFMPAPAAKPAIG